MNQVNIIGRLGGEVELKFTPGGKAVANLTLAVDDGWGENKKTAWIGVTLWGAAAELAKKALQKGHRCGITGRLSQEEWEDKEGKKQRKTKVTAENLHLLEPKRATEDAPPQQETRHQSAGMPPSPRQSKEVPSGKEPDDLPF